MQIDKFTKTALALGSTSAIALTAAVDDAKADGFYIGLSAGGVSGDHPGPGGSDEAYQLGGPVLGVFSGIDTPIGNNGAFVGAEIAFTGPFEGDTKNLSSYEYGYDINYNIDGKLRIGRSFDDFDVYGFGGVSVGETDGCCYGNSYRYYGLNVGLGVSYDFNDRFFVGAEYIHRFTTGTFDDENGHNANHGAASIRAGVRF